MHTVYLYHFISSFKVFNAEESNADYANTSDYV